MLTIRLTRTGSKKRPSYRIIVSEKRYKRDGRYIDKLGFYNPLTEPTTVSVDREKFDYWVKQGAQPSATVKRIVLGIKGTKKRKPKKAQAVVEEAAPEAASATPAEAPVAEQSTSEDTPAEVAETTDSETTEESESA